MELDKERKIPKTLGECLEIDPLSKNLWGWAENLESFGKILLAIILVCGFVLVIYAGIAANEEYESVWGAVLSTGFTWILYAFIEYCVYHALSLLMSALATIVQNTTITANIAAYHANSVKDTHDSVQTPTEDSNKITHLEASINNRAEVEPQHVEDRPENQTASEESVCIGKRPKEEFQCPKCKAYQRVDRDFCWKCGTKFIFDSESGNK